MSRTRTPGTPSLLRAINDRAALELLLDGLASSSSRWNVVAQQVYMAAIDLAPGPGQAFNTDKLSLIHI